MQLSVTEPSTMCWWEEVKHIYLLFCLGILVISVLWHSFLSHWMLPSLFRKQGAVLCEFTRLTRWPPWRSAKISWFGKQCVFFLILRKGLPVPCGIHVWAKAEGGFRRPWRICVSSRSSGGGRLGPRERKSELITWVKCVKCSNCIIGMIIMSIYWKWTKGYYNQEPTFARLVF